MEQGGTTLAEDQAADPATDHGLSSGSGGRGQGRSPRRHALRVGLVFVVLLAAFLVVTFPDGDAGKVGTLPVTAHADEAIAALQYHDARWYIEIGRDLAAHHGLVPGKYYLLDFNFWPPGMFLYWAALFSLLGPDIPVGITAGIALSVLFAALLTAYAELLVRYLPRWAVVLLLAAVVFSDAMSQGILGSWLLLSEGLYLWWMLVALYAALRLALARSSRAGFGWALVVGAALGGSAYIRSVSELLGRVLTLVLVLWGAIEITRRIVDAVRARRSESRTAARQWSRHLIALLLCMAAFHVVTVPWRVVAAQTIRPGNYTWSVFLDRSWHWQWTPDRAFKDYGVGLFAEGGANTACHVDPKKCREIGIDTFRGPNSSGQARYRRLALETLAAHPWEWIYRKLVLLPHAWFAPPNPCGTAAFPTCRTRSGYDSGHELLQSTFLLAALAASLALSFRRIRRSGADLLALLTPILFATTFAPFLLLGIEVRYLFPLKIFSVFALVALLAADRASTSQAEKPSRHTDAGTPETAPGPGMP